jgi:hypothetical protein
LLNYFQILFCTFSHLFCLTKLQDAIDFKCQGSFKKNINFYELSYGNFTQGHENSCFSLKLHHHPPYEDFLWKP